MSRQGMRHAKSVGDLLVFGPTVLVLALSVLSMVGCQKAPSKLSNNGTGIINGTVDTGTEAWAGTVVGIGDKKGEGYEIWCSGTLIGQNTVVTAGHCVAPMGSDNYVVFGLTENGATVQGRKIVNKAYHDKYGSVVIDEYSKDVFDIGVVQFEGDMPAGFRPAEMLADDTVLQNGTEIVLVGYGVTNAIGQSGSGILRHTRVRLRDAAYGTTEVQTDEVASGSCNGDSGGPGLIEMNGHVYLWGTTSRGDVYCRNNGIYTKVTSYREWLTQKVLGWARGENFFAMAQ